MRKALPATKPASNGSGSRSKSPAGTASSRSSILPKPVETSAYTIGLITSRPPSRARARGSPDRCAQVASSVRTSSMTLESTRVAAHPAVTAVWARGSFATQQFQELVRAHGGGRPAAHLVHESLPPGRAPLGTYDAQCVAVFDDVYLVTLMEAVPLAQGSGDRHLALAVEPHRIS